MVVLSWGAVVFLIIAELIRYQAILKTVEGTAAKTATGLVYELK